LTVAERPHPRRTVRASLLALVAFAALGLGACGSSGGGASTYKEPVGAPIATVTIESGNLFFKPKTLTLDRPGIYDLKLVNTQSGEHTLVFGDKVKGFRLQVVGERSSDSAKVDLKSGSYTFWCDVPGHRQAGMEGKLTVR
jgi:uncharacterized cupredoxin-like copper-binding protein